MDGIDLANADVMEISRLLDRPDLDDRTIISALEALGNMRHFGVIGWYILNDGLSDDVILRGLRLLAEDWEGCAISDIANLLRKEGLSGPVREKAMEYFLQEMIRASYGDIFSSGVTDYVLRENRELRGLVLKGLEKREGESPTDEVFRFLVHGPLDERDTERAAGILVKNGHGGALEEKLISRFRGKKPEIRGRKAEIVRNVLERQRNPLEGDGMASVPQRNHHVGVKRQGKIRT